MKRKLTTAFRRAMYPSADPQTEHDVAHEKIYNQRNIQSSRRNGTHAGQDMEKSWCKSGGYKIAKSRV